MKRCISILLLLAILISLSGCGNDDSTPTSQEPQATQTAVIAPTATPMPIETPKPELLKVRGEYIDLLPQDAKAVAQANRDGNIEQYSSAFSSMKNTSLAIKFSYPENWILEPGIDTITYVENDTFRSFPARFSVTSYKYTEKSLSNKKLKEHLRKYLISLVEPYNEYQIDSVNSSIQFAQSTAMVGTYLAIKGNSYVRGIAVVGYGKNNRVYCMHFCCEASEFDSYQNMIKSLAAAVKPIE